MQVQPRPQLQPSHTILFTWAGFDEMDDVKRLRLRRAARQRMSSESTSHYPIGDEAGLKAKRDTSSTADYTRACFRRG